MKGILVILRNRLDRLWGKVIRARDGNTCQRCGRSWPNYKVEAAHIHAKSSCPIGLRWDLMNGVTLCFVCHEDKWHKQGDGTAWFKKKYPNRWRYLERRLRELRESDPEAGKSQTQKIEDRQATAKFLSEKLNELNSDGYEKVK